MNRALWLLIGLQVRGWLRFLTRNVASVRGALLALVGLMFFVPWLMSVAWVGYSGAGALEPQKLRLYGPAVLLAYCLGNVLFSTAEKPIYFTPAEVNFLFPGPFGRREVLAYKVLWALVINLPAVLLMTFVFQVQVRGSWFPAAYVGLLLIFLFMHLFSMALSLAGTSVGARVYTRGRKLVLAGLVVLAAAVVVQAGGSPAGWRREDFARVVQTPAWQWATTPLRWFFDAFLATRAWPDLALYGGLALLVDLALLAVVFALDAEYLESAASASARIYARIQRLRGRATGVEEAPGRKVRLGVPDLPWWGGVGPVLWRQLTTALRGLGRVVLLFTVLGMVMVGPMVGTLAQQEEVELTPVVGGMVLVMGVFLTALVPFDFRGDVDRIAALKTLPLPAWRLALGQVLTPVLMVTAMQWLVLAAVLAFARAGELPLLLCAAYAPPFNFLLFALENLMFLMFPTRLMAAAPGDFQALGRNVLFLTVKGLLLMLVALLAGMAGVVTWLLTGGNVPAALLAGWPVVALSGLALLPLVAHAFNEFDVGRDTPP